MVAVATGVVSLVAVLHVYFLVLEMFLWQTPFGMQTFGTTPEVAAASAVLAANQGLYNGFLAAGLLWGLFGYGVVRGRSILTFFLLCAVIAGASKLGHSFALDDVENLRHFGVVLRV